MADGRQVSDVGGELLRILNENRILWKKLPRSNTRNLHPLLFGIYGDLVYHHGTGFRTSAMLMLDHVEHIVPIKSLYGRILLRCLPRRWRKDVRNSFLHPEGRIRRRLIKRNAIMSRKVYSALSTDPEAFIATLR
jgi:hypothetical protein